ncbi:MAG: hypothetical protein JXB88_08385 [Spirochaetales bacterium]|nr:hypothetical protein [Spirochaetales bacterium]
MFKKVSFLLLSVLLVVSCIINTHAQTATIDANTVQQLIRGFGAANIIGWRDDMTSADRTLAFSVEDGLGFSVIRVRVSPDSSDWASNIDSIEAAKSHGAMVIASAWSAPASMKTNNNTIGGNLKSGSYADYATHLRNFCSAVGGVDAISPINEPNISVDYESMQMSASDVAAFVAAQGNNCGAPIFAPEPYNMDQSFINQYLSNSGAKANTTYIAGHIYGTSPSHFDPGKEVWMTEHYVDSGTNGNDWNKSMNVARELHDCMVAGYSMYVWWYIKRYYGPIEEDGTATKTGYVMAQFAKWVRPGFNKISCTTSPVSNVYTTAYKNGSDLVVVAVNRNSSASNVNFNLSGMTVSSLTSYTTTSSSNLVSGNVPVSGSSFSVSLPGSSITTLVSGGGTQVTPTPTTPVEPTPTPLTTGNIMVRARGTMGGEIMELRIDNNLVASWTMSTSYQDYYADGSGTIEVHFTNDDELQNGLDIQVDYITYNGVTYQAEDQEVNTGVYIDGSCGGSYSEMLQCNGYIRFDTGTGPTTPPVNLGDANSDGTIDIVDALLIAQYYVGLNPQDFDPAAADTNCDGTIDIIDALLVAQYYVGLVNSFC